MSQPIDLRAERVALRAAIDQALAQAEVGGLGVVYIGNANNRRKVVVNYDGRMVMIRIVDRSETQ
jgi:hypothetical protein